MIYDLFSKRAFRENGGAPDVYQYDSVPITLRVQVVHLWQRWIGPDQQYSRARNIYRAMCAVLREEYGVLHLTPARDFLDGYAELTHFFLEVADHTQALDIIEISMRVESSDSSVAKDSACQTLNQRLREAGVGYQFESDRLIKVNSQIIHSEIIKPTLIFLSDSLFSGANQEFLEAHRYYRLGEYKSCLVECMKTFESVMKIICAERNWTVQGQTATKLVETLFSNGLIPDYLQSQFSSLRGLLQSGIATVRNRQGGHGQGAQVQQVPEYLAAYVLHQTAATVLFLVKSHQEQSLP